MNVPTILVGLFVLAVFTAIVGRGIYNKRRGRGGCSCGGDCGACGACRGTAFPDSRPESGDVKRGL